NDSRIPPGDSLSINLTVFVYGWLRDKSRRRRSDDRYLAVRSPDSGIHFNSPFHLGETEDSGIPGGSHIISLSRPKSALLTKIYAT
ncbi:hypothetical protein M9458_023148, partial [Cirrhinus mrigala]